MKRVFTALLALATVLALIGPAQAGGRRGATCAGGSCAAPAPLELTTTLRIGEVPVSAAPCTEVGASGAPACAGAVTVQTERRGLLHRLRGRRCR